MLIDIQYLQKIILALKKVRMVKVTTIKRFPQSKFPILAPTT